MEARNGSLWIKKYCSCAWHCSLSQRFMLQLVTGELQATSPFFLFRHSPQ
ncbi:MAG TPA: DUF3927 domain-containing protein [Candidatus Poseidoniales archaeon]|nr:MAG TPA: DUF3927 domain-containing protein [Candidatus Poseidoniales archaeon]